MRASKFSSRPGPVVSHHRPQDTSLPIPQQMVNDMGVTFSHDVAVHDFGPRLSR